MLYKNNYNKKIAVCGSNSVTSVEVINTAEKVGSEIAKRGGILLCGGMGGVMEAVSRGAKKSNGITVGILPVEDKLEANKYIDIPINTSLGKIRNFFVVSLADAVIGIAGSWGTLSELSMAINLNKKVILLDNTGGIVNLLISQQSLITDANYFVVSDAKSAVDEAFSSK